MTEEELEAWLERYARLVIDGYETEERLSNVQFLADAGRLISRGPKDQLYAGCEVAHITTWSGAGTRSQVVPQIMLKRGF